MAGSGDRRWLLPLLLALCITRFWLLPLPSSFWLDETATVFVARHGSQHPSLAVAAPQAWHSWYYALIRWNGALFGYSEIATRLVSVLAMLVFLGLFARVAARLVHPQAAWFAVFACLALPGFNYQAANARPYAVGMLVFAAAVWLLVRWLDSGNWLPGAGFAVAAAAVLYIHLLFWPCCLVFALYTAARLAYGKTPVGRGRHAGVPSRGRNGRAAARRPRACHRATPVVEGVRSLARTRTAGCVRGRRMGASAAVAPAPGTDRARSTGIGSDRRLVAVPARRSLCILAADRRCRFCAPLSATRASRRGPCRNRGGRSVPFLHAMEPSRFGHGLRRASVWGRVANALAETPQFRLARRRPRGESNRGDQRSPRDLSQSLHRSAASGLAAELLAARISLRPSGRLPDRFQTLSVSVRDLSESRIVRIRVVRHGAASFTPVPDLRMGAAGALLARLVCAAPRV